MECIRINISLSLSLSILTPMASVTSSPSPSSAPSAPNSEHSATQLTPRTPSHDEVSVKDVATDNDVRDALEKKPLSVDPFEDMNSEEGINKFKKYEADYTSQLMAKYFSEKDIYGGNLRPESVTIDGETITASRWHCAQSYADPVQFLKDKSTCSSTSPADSPTGNSDGKHSMQDR